MGKRDKYLVFTIALSAVVFLAASVSRGEDEQPPPKKRTPEEFAKFKKKLDWFYKAKYGIMFHFLPNMHRFRRNRAQWTPEKWNAWVDAVDVEKVAKQARDVGAGYVILSISQGGGFACVRNPVIAKHWGLKPEDYGSARDLPTDLYEALKKYDIKMMLYIASSPHLMPGPKSEKAGWFGNGFKFAKCTPEGARHWAEVVKWYSEHYGTKVSGWWLDGLREWAPGYREMIHKAAIAGNPDAITASATYALSDFTHGHCVRNWKKQQKNVPKNRWDPTYKIQWHAFQYLGHSWAARDAPRSTESLVDYAVNVVKNGGVITFDVGTFEEEKGKPVKGPLLEMAPKQYQQLLAIKKALENLERKPGADPGDGKGEPEKSAPSDNASGRKDEK